MPRHERLFAAIGVCLAFGVPAVALIESHVRGDLSAVQSAILLATTPWLILIWVKFVERRPMSSIGLRRPGWCTVGYGLLGIAVNVGISVAIGSLAMKMGIHEVDSGFPEHLIRQGYGWLLVLIVTGGALMTEIAFRGYAVDDIVFTAFYFWRRDTTSCLVAHAVPNFVASTLAALGVAN
jgi:hypothetical protein